MSTSPGPEPPHAPLPRIWPFKRVYFGWAVVFASLLAGLGAVPAHGPVIGLFFEPMEQELGWSYFTLSLAFTLGSAGSAFTSLLIGRYIDRYGARAITVISGFALTGSLIGLSLVTQPWHYWLFFGIARAVSQAGVGIGGSVAVAKWFVRMRGRALAVKATGLRASQAVMPLVIYAIMAAWDWRMAWLALGVMAAVLVILPGWLLMRRQPEDFGLEPDGDAPEAPDEGQGEGKPGKRRRDAEISWTLAEARKTRSFWLILFLLMMTPFTMGATNLHLATTFYDKGLSDATVVTVLVIFAVTSAVVITPLGYLYDKIHVRYGGMLLAALLLLAMVIAILPGGLWMAVLFAVVFGLATGSRGLVETLLLANYFGRGSLGALRGFAGPFRLISPLGPLYAGLVRDLTGSYALAFGTFAVVAAVMGAVMFFAKQPVHPSQVVQPASGSAVQ
ncbi:MAG: MFS transporter [Dehalococcoidia bacterium]